MKHDPIKTEPVIHDLASFKVSYFFQNEPIPPVLLQLISLIAVMSADADHKTFVETGIDPILEGQGKEVGHG